MSEIGIGALVGANILSGIDRFNEDRKTYSWSDRTENVEVVRVRIGDRVVEFAEDPGDGYRSGHNGPFVIEASLRNTFAPVAVLCSHVIGGRSEYSGESDVLRICNAETGAVILEVGTDNVDDYYPSWICDFSAKSIGLDPTARSNGDE